MAVTKDYQLMNNETTMAKSSQAEITTTIQNNQSMIILLKVIRIRQRRIRVCSMMNQLI